MLRGKDSVHTLQLGRNSALAMNSPGQFDTHHSNMLGKRNSRFIKVHSQVGQNNMDLETVMQSPLKITNLDLNNKKLSFKNQKAKIRTEI